MSRSGCSHEQVNLRINFQAACLSVLNELYTHPISLPFADAVDVTLPSPDGGSASCRRLGLNDIRCKVVNNEYATVYDCLDDIERIFSLSLVVNPEGTLMGMVTAEMQMHFRKLTKHLLEPPGRKVNKLYALRDKLDSMTSDTSCQHDEQPSGSALVRTILQEMERNEHFQAFQLEHGRTHRANYRHLFESGAMLQIIDFLSQETLPSIWLVELHESTRIPLNTLKTWRHELRSDPPHMPYGQPANISKRGLTTEQEEALALRIRSDFGDQKRYCPPRLVQTMARKIYRESYEASSCDGTVTDGETEAAIEPNDDEFVPSGEEQPRRFLASRKWRGKFLKRFGFSIRQPHAKRRPVVMQDDITSFQVRLENILSQYPLDHVINMDETSWKLLNTGFATVAYKGSETVECFFNGGPKMCLTAIAAIDAAGGKLPIWILCHGKTARCERRYRANSALEKAIKQGKLFLSHEDNGWTTAQVASEWLNWLKSRFPSDPVVLLWDVFTSHRCEATKALAKELNIRLEFIPPGATGNCQPLDRRIFGSLKSRARERFDALWAQDHEPTMQDSVAMLLDAWRSIDQFEVLSAWETVTH
jgi:hypothetical protein